MATAGLLPYFPTWKKCPCTTKFSKVLASASTLDKDLRDGATGNIDAATKVGSAIAERAKKAGVEAAYFDRGGFLFHGKVKALADAAREGGLKI